MEAKSAWRTTPPALLVAFVAWFVFTLVRVVAINAMTFERGYSTRLLLTSEGIVFAAVILVMVGLLELMGRRTGRARSMLKLALAGISFTFVVDTLAGFVQFAKEPWHHEWIYKVYEYCAIVGWLVFAVGLALALPATKRAFGFAVIAVTAITWLPRPFVEAIWDALGVHDVKAQYTAETLLHAVRIAMFGLLCVKVSGGDTPPQPALAADGFRLAGKGLWVNVIIAVTFAVFMMMTMAGGGGSGAFSVFKMLLVAKPAVAVIALTLIGLGAVRAARSTVSDLQPYILAISGGAALWVAGVSLAQLPTMYKLFYGGDPEFGPRETESLDVFSITVPLVVIVAVGLLAAALSGYAARRGNEDLRTDAQGKGLGYVVLTLVSLGMASWMLPKASSKESAVMLLLLVAVANLWATVMMAKLFGRGADVLEAEPGLPPASVISATPPV